MVIYVFLTSNVNISKFKQLYYYVLDIVNDENISGYLSYVLLLSKMTKSQMMLFCTCDFYCNIRTSSCCPLQIYSHCGALGVTFS